VLPVIEKRVRHGARFNIVVSQIQPGRAENPPVRPWNWMRANLARRALRVFDHQKKLIAIAEAVVPRTYQPIVVFEPLP